MRESVREKNLSRSDDARHDTEADVAENARRGAMPGEKRAW